MANDFLETLQRNPVQDNTSPALDILNEFCDAIRDYKPHLECWLQAGFPVNYGQEWRVMIKPKSRDYEQILLRAYVPLNGFPAWLDLSDEEPVKCADEGALRQNLDDFLRQEETLETILFLSKQAA